jgi:hypothetical protein
MSSTRKEGDVGKCKEKGSCEEVEKEIYKREGEDLMDLKEASVKDLEIEIERRNLLAKEERITTLVNCINLAHGDRKIDRIVYSDNIRRGTGNSTSAYIVFLKEKVGW